MSTRLFALSRSKSGDEVLIAVGASIEDVRRARCNDFVAHLREAFPGGIDETNEEAHDRFCQSINYRIEEISMGEHSAEKQTTFDPFDKLEGRKITKAMHRQIVEGKPEHIAVIEFDDGSVMSFNFIKSVFLQGVPSQAGRLSFTFTPVNKAAQ